MTAAARAAASPYGTQVTSPGSGSNGVAVGLLGGQRERAHGAAVEGALGGDDVGAAGAPGQLERRLVGLGAGVGEEHLARSAPSSASSFSASSTCGALAKKLEMWPSVPQLAGHGLDEGRVGVAERVDGDAAEQVDVLVAVVVPDVRALAAGEHQLRRAEGVHQRAGVPLLAGRSCTASSLAFRVLVSTPGSTWVPTPSLVNSSRSTACGSRPSTTVARGDAVLHGLEAGAHLRDHARGERRQDLRERLGADLADHVLGVRPVEVEALDVGEHQQLLGAERDRERRRRRSRR